MKSILTAQASVVFQIVFADLCVRASIKLGVLMRASKWRQGKLNLSEPDSWDTEAIPAWAGEPVTIRAITLPPRGHSRVGGGT